MNFTHKSFALLNILFPKTSVWGLYVDAPRMIQYIYKHVVRTWRGGSCPECQYKEVRQGPHTLSKPLRGREEQHCTQWAITLYELWQALRQQMGGWGFFRTFSADEIVSTKCIEISSVPIKVHISDLAYERYVCKNSSLYYLYDPELYTFIWFIITILFPCFMIVRSKFLNEY